MGFVNKSWSESEIEYLKVNANSIRHQDIANYLGRTKGSVEKKIRLLGLCKREWRKWTNDEISFLKKNYNVLTYREIATALSRDKVSVGGKAAEIGLKGKRIPRKVITEKICNRCKKKKKISEFRWRFDGDCLYVNSECKQCGKERAAIYYAKMKDNPEFKEKNRKRQKEYTEKNIEQIRERRHTKEYRAKHLKWEKDRQFRKKDEIAAKNKIKRQTPAYKKMMREYREKNKDKIKEQEVVTKRRYQVKNMEAITDKYVAQKLGLRVSEIQTIKDQFPEIFEIKRAQLFFDRELRKLHKK